MCYSSLREVSKVFARNVWTLDTTCPWNQHTLFRFRPIEKVVLTTFPGLKSKLNAFFLFDNGRQPVRRLAAVLSSVRLSQMSLTLVQARRMTLGRLLQEAARANPSGRAVVLIVSWVARGASLARKPSEHRLLSLLPLIAVSRHDEALHFATRTGTVRHPKKLGAGPSRRPSGASASSSPRGRTPSG